MGFLCGCAGRLTAQNGDFRSGQCTWHTALPNARADRVGSTLTYAAGAARRGPRRRSARSLVTGHWSGSSVQMRMG
jgi:hypothetical protein